MEIIKNIDTLDIYHLKIENINGELIYDRKLCEGPGPSIYGLRVCEALGLDSEFMNIAKEIQKTLLNKEKITLSPYNKDILVDKCKICNSNAEETHHINEQQNADKNGNIKHFHKNDKHNLVPLCSKCHLQVTNHEIVVKGWKETSDGDELEWYPVEKVEKTRKQAFFSLNGVSRRVSAVVSNSFRFGQNWTKLCWVTQVASKLYISIIKG